jgi:Domain of unknown function (DUF4410)
MGAHERTTGERATVPAGRGQGAVIGAVVVGLGLAVMAGCARTSIQDRQVMATGLPRPQLIVVHDFIVSPHEVTLDSGMRSRLQRLVTDSSGDQERLKAAQSVSHVLTEALVKEIGALGIPTVAAHAAPATAGPGPTASIHGQFLSIDAGNQTRRMFVGFGAGASEVRLLVQVFETMNQREQLVEDFYSTVKSSRKPGMGPMAGAGAAMGHAASSAALSGGVGIMSERNQTVQGDAQNVAKEIAKQIKDLFAREGWIGR